MISTNFLDFFFISFVVQTQTHITKRLHDLGYAIFGVIVAHWHTEHEKRVYCNAFDTVVINERTEKRLKMHDMAKKFFKAINNWHAWIKTNCIKSIFISVFSTATKSNPSFVRNFFWTLRVVGNVYLIFFWIPEAYQKF